MVAGSNHAAVAHQYWRCIDDRAFKQVAQIGKFTHFLAQHLYRRAVNALQLGAQFRQLLEGMAHTGKIAWAGGTQRQTRQNTFQIANLAQYWLQICRGILQGADSLLAFGQYFGIAHRHMQPAFQHSAAHRRDGAIEHRCEGIFQPAGQVLGNLKITARGGIHDDAVLLTIHGDGANVRQGSALSIFDILQ